MFLDKAALFLIFPCLALAQSFDSNRHNKRAITPDNTCGGAKAYTCNPDDPRGGSCCSSSGFCGYTAPYCGTGCQPAFGSCFGVSPAATRSGNFWVVDGVGRFTNTQTFEFTGSSLPAGLTASDYTVNEANVPYAHVFLPADVTVSGGYLQLKVPGGQTVGPLKSAEVVTTISNIKYASVRTTAILGGPAGTCNSIFFYKSDTQEIDIEYLSDPQSSSNPPDHSRPMQYTNQPFDGNPNNKDYAIAPSPSDASTVAHEYRIDWIADATLFYLDGVLQKKLTKSVPTIPGSWVWNNWANGSPGWTGAPPQTDNIFKISKIVMYYNTA